MFSLRFKRYFLKFSLHYNEHNNAVTGNRSKDNTLNRNGNIFFSRKWIFSAARVKVPNAHSRAKIQGHQRSFINILGSLFRAYAAGRMAGTLCLDFKAFALSRMSAINACKLIHRSTYALEKSYCFDGSYSKITSSTLEVFFLFITNSYNKFKHQVRHQHSTN